MGQGQYLGPIAGGAVDPAAKPTWVFEELAWWHIPLIELLARLGRNSLYLKHYLSPSFLPWLEHAEAFRLLTRLKPAKATFRFNRFTAAKAYELAEETYPLLVRSCPFPAWLEKRRGSDAVHLAYRKRLMRELDDYLDYQVLITSVLETLPEGRRIVFVPTSPAKAAGLSLPKSARAGVRLPRFVRILGRAQMLVSNLFLGALAIIFLLDGALRLLKRRPRVEPADYAIGIIGPLREFANDLRWSGFLIDGKDIRTDNTLFIWLASLGPVARLMARLRGIPEADIKLGPAHREALARRGVRFSEPATRSPKGAPAAVRETAYVLARGLLQPPWILAGSYELIREQWIWSSFLDVHPIRHFIVYADFLTRQFGRNIALKARGVQTWYYSDSTNTPDQFSTERTYREFHWGYLYYDRFVTWGDRHARFMLQHHQRVGEYINVGCLWSEHVRELLAGEIPSKIKEERLKRLPENLKILGVFDGSYVDESYSPYSVGIAFAEDLKAILDARPDLGMILKPKKPFEIMSRQSGDRQGLERAYEALAKHPRCWVADYKRAVAEVIAESDLVVGLAFSSTVLEALGARRKGVFYDPGNRFPNSYYDQIPELIAHDPVELRRLVDFWLNEVSDAGLSIWLNRYLKPDVDSHLDGLGLTRFRRLLAAKIQ